MEKANIRVLFAILVMTGACGASEEPPGGEADAGIDPTPQELCTEEHPELPPLVEDRSVYDQDSVDELIVELTIDDLADLAAVNSNTPDATVRAVFRERGVYGDDAIETNALVKLRGRSTRLAIQKSYKIQLDSKSELWRGQRELNLNKHPYDLTRIRNKLSFDLFRTTPNFTSMRTQFVHLFINGEDMGLFTHVEEGDRIFLNARGLDANGTLYKIASFNFRPVEPEVAMDPVAFESVVESKAIPDQAKFLRMVEAVNDESNDINEVIATHFNRDNYMTWLASNAIVGNFDTGSSNYYLYSPSSCEGWYFFPWDFDGALGFFEQPGNPPRPRWRAGLANWWLPILHRRFFEHPQNVNDLVALVADLRRTVFTDAAIADLMDSYYPIVSPLAMSPPDLWNLPILDTPDPTDMIAKWNLEYERVYDEVDRLQSEFKSALHRPMPVRMHSVDLRGNKLEFEWDDSFDLQGDGLYYDFAVSTTPEFADADILYEQEGLTVTTAITDTLSTGVYYWRIVINDDQNPAHWQTPFHEYEAFSVE